MIESIRSQLRQMADPEYRLFQSKLMPTIPFDTVLGVRTPQLRQYARKLFASKTYTSFFDDLPHAYYEENNLHGFLIEQIDDFDVCVRKLERFLPYIDNWATCDGLKPKCFSGHGDDLIAHVDQWLVSDHPYTVRYGIGVLMTHYLDAAFDARYLQKVASIQSDHYYVKMMIAWYFATALAKQWDETIIYLEKKHLPLWTHNKTIQKAIESYRIPAERKIFLRSLKQHKV